MLFEPKDLYESLEFNKILNLLEGACLGEPARAAVSRLPLETEPALIESKLLEVKELKLSMEEGDHFPIRAYESVDKELRMLEVVDFVLPIEGLQRLHHILSGMAGIVKFFTKGRQNTYPKLYRIVEDISFDPELEAAIDRVIDEEGKIKPDASSQLMKIRKLIVSKQKELEKQFRILINTYRAKGWLSDSVESFRNGRRVLSVPSEHKRKIRGIIHDESTTGKTAFIEPEAVIDINNDIFDLETEERREIYRILKELSAKLKPYTGLFERYQSVLIRYDLIQAKAVLAIRLKANMPTLKPHPYLAIKEGYHPLLLLKNQRSGKKTVPFDLILFKDNRILVLSGPNAGGKSITMKSVGLLQLMLQMGMLIPVAAESEMGVFKAIFADIGDQQSLEDELSTYSSRLRNMRIFLEKADGETLILIDEFGSGTDPKIGGAIAEAILKELNAKKVYGLITTHYSNLKMFAFKTKGIVNGSMTFDKDTLSPTYEMRIGRPGSSYAFEIAQKSGLSKKILRYAKHKTGKNEKAIDELLVDLQREKQDLTDQLQAMKVREKQLEKLIRNYEDMHRDLEFKRKKLKLDAKEKALQQSAKDNREFEQLIREIKESKNLEKAKRLASKVRTERKVLSKQVEHLKEEIYYQPDVKEAKKGPLEVGDFVRLRTGGATGRIDSITKNKVVVVMGQMKMTVKLRDLQHANEPLDIQSSKGIKMDTVNDSAAFESKIDLRGMRRDEALKVLERFVDKALISNATQLRILHGKGDGILRKAVKEKLREYQVITTIRHPEREEGGDGVTIAEIE